jgi:hypothetical protein
LMWRETLWKIPEIQWFWVTVVFPRFCPGSIHTHTHSVFVVMYVCFSLLRN